MFPSDGRHFKSVYGKDLVESLLAGADQVSSELERSTDERLALHQNKSACLQGQIDLIRTHQAVQDQRISFAVAREAEDADARANERCFFSFLLLFNISCFAFALPLSLCFFLFVPGIWTRSF